MRQITNWSELEALKGTTCEGADLDFKRMLGTGTEKDSIEAAKDLAAMANVLGGHLLVGVEVELGRTRCAGFPGIDKVSAGTVGTALEHAVKERLNPPPVINVRAIDVPQSENVVVVVRVEASPVAPVGVSLRQAEGGRLVAQGWAFPFRIGSQTEWLSPDQFGAFESMSARRMAALLSGIPQNERKLVQLRWSNGASAPVGAGYGDGQELHLESLKVEFVNVELLNNAALFQDRNHPVGGFNGVPIYIPLDHIESLWRVTAKGEAVWQVALKGQLFPVGDKDGDTGYDYWAGPVR